tara:strand:+ start:81 stop:548 length:468 start_codon:yes stop_codon:yes gene_type:complete
VTQTLLTTYLVKDGSVQEQSLGRENNMLPFIGPVISGVLGIGKTYLNNKAEVAKAKHVRQLTSIEGDQTWEIEQAKNQAGSWKDEFALVVIISPFIAMFLASVFNEPEMVARIGEAFVILKMHVPEEYWYLLGVAFASTFAIKGVPNMLNKIRGK